MRRELATRRPLSLNMKPIIPLEGVKPSIHNGGCVRLTATTNNSCLVQDRTVNIWFSVERNMNSGAHIEPQHRTFVSVSHIGAANHVHANTRIFVYV